YTEQVTIDKELKLVGAGAANTTIQVPAPPLSGSHDIVTIGAMGKVELTGFTVSGPLPLPAVTCNVLGAGIDVQAGGTANIHDNTIADVRHEPLDGCQEGNGIDLGSLPSGAAMATIVNNTIVRYQKRGIRVQGAGSTATVIGNTVMGVGATPEIAQNGIQVSFGGRATGRGTPVPENECAEATCGPNPLGAQAAGILLFSAADGTAVTGNSVTGSDIGIYDRADGATTLTGNILTDNRDEGIVLDQGAATVDSNTIDPARVGIAVISLNGNTADSSGTVTCNLISGSTEAGIRLLIQAGSTSHTFVTANANSIMGNLAGIDNTTADMVAAPINWWGCPLGPGHTGCDPVNGPVDFSAPLAAPPECAP